MRLKQKDFSNEYAVWVFENSWFFNEKKTDFFEIGNSEKIVLECIAQILFLVNIVSTLSGKFFCKNQKKN